MNFLVIAICFERDDTKRNFFLAAAALNMTSDDYVYVILEFRGLGFSEFFKKIFKQNKSIVIIKTLNSMFLDAPISMNSTLWSYINDLTNASWPASIKDLDPSTTINYGLVPIWIDQISPIDGMDNIVSLTFKKI